MTRRWQSLIARVAAEADRPAASDIERMAEAVCRQHSGVAAIVAYGSCLRGVSAADSLIDLYVLVRRREDVSRNRLLRLACRLLPPNVHFAEIGKPGEKLRCKYAIMTLASFRRRMTAWNPYFWARFAQPVRLLRASDGAEREAILYSLAQACVTMFGECRNLAAPGDDRLSALTRCLRTTYATELRAERSDRASTIVDANRTFYLDVAELVSALDAGVKAGSPRGWKARIIVGKLLSVARLVKSAFTFEGGMDYLSWKIERHSGQKIEVSEWQRRHPIVAGVLLLPRLWRSNAVR
jgi:predicted nucleotidyltransferase